MTNMGVVMVSIMGVVSLVRYSSHSILAATLMVVVGGVLMAVRGVVGAYAGLPGPGEQGLPLLLLHPLLLEVEDTLLYGQDQEESKHHDELGNRIVKIHIVLVLDLFQHLAYFFFHIREKVQQAGSYEDTTSKAGGEADQHPPPDPGGHVWVVPELGEELEWHHAKQEGNDGHGQQRDDLLSDHAHT